MISTIDHLYQIANTIAANDQDIDYSPDQFGFPRATPAEIDQLLEDALTAYWRDPHLGRGLAAVAWAAAQSYPDLGLKARAALAYGRTLVRAEHPNVALAVLQKARILWLELENDEQVALCDWQRGVALQLQNRYPEAVDILTSAAERLQIAGNWLDAARCRRDLTITLDFQGQAQLAGEHIKKAISYFQENGDIVELARCHVADAARLQWLGHFEKALKRIATALYILGKENLALEQGIAHYIVAFIYMQRDTLSEAIGSSHQSRRFFEQVRLPHRIALCDNLLGGAYLRTLHPKEAIPHLKTAASWFAQHDLPVDLARSKTNLGIAYALLGNLVLARHELLAAIPLLEAANETHSVANCQTQIGVVLQREGRYEEALSYLEIAWYYWQSLKRPLFTAQCAMHLSDTCQFLGLREKALGWLKAALDSYHSIDSTIGIIRSQLEMSRFFTKEGQLERATELAISARSNNKLSPADLALCEHCLGEISTVQRDWDTAASHFFKSAQTFSQIGVQVHTLKSQIAWGDALRHNDPTKAQAILEETQNKTAELRLPDLAWRSAAALAELARQSGDHEVELDHLEAAGQWLASARRRLSQPSLAQSFLNERIHPLERGLEISFELGRPESTLFFNDELRSQCLSVQLLRLAHRQPIFDHYGTSLAVQRRDLLAELNMLEHKLCAKAVGQEPIFFSSQQADLVHRHQETALAYEDVCVQLERAGFRGQIEPVDINPVNIKKLQSTGYHYLSYYLQKEVLIIFSITPGKITMSRRILSGLDQMALKTCASQQPQERSLIYGRPGSPIANPNLSRQWRQQLFDLLIPQEAIEEFLPDRPLIIVPHGLLYGLPFHALLDPNGRPLIELTSVTYAPSLALLQVIAEQTQEQSEADSALIIGIRNFNNRHPELINACEEAITVAQSLRFPSKLLLDGEATEAGLLSLTENEASIHQYKLIHLATHGFSGVQYGRLAGFALSDCDLRLDDLQSLNLSAPLVVLSACETGLGIDQSDGGAGGVTSVFFALGAKSVIATFWSLFDPHMEKIMTSFYKHFEEGLSPAIALAHTQRELDLPTYYWASLACFGLP